MFNLRKDETLIEKALGGSQSSWTSLVKRYEGLIYNYCLRMTFNSADAMDLLQEVFLAIYRNLPSYRGEGQFKGWMMRIAANKTTDFIRAKYRNPLQQADPVQQDAHYSEGAPHLDYEYTAKNRQIMKILSYLPLEQRLVIELKFFQHLTFEEIAEQTGTAVSTIKTRLYSALEKLKGFEEIQNAM